MLARPAHEPGHALGPFVINGALGEGGMGVVYDAREASGRRVAVKVLHAELAADSDLVARFLREARAAGCVSHPNVVAIPDAGLLPDGRPYLVMPCLEGETLAARMARAPMSGAEVLQLSRQMVSGLAAAHAARVVHRDLKPHNVFLTRAADGQLQVKLLDFGLAKMEHDDAGPLSRTRSLIGTPAYLAPEQARGRAAAPACDVYALGVMLFQLLVGRLPFEADNTADLIAAHLREPPPRARSLRPELPAAIDELLARMLVKDPAERASLDDVEQAIGRSSKALGALPAPLVQVTLPAPTRSSRRVVVLAMVALGAIVAAVVVVQSGKVLLPGVALPVLPVAQQAPPRPAPVVTPVLPAAPPPVAESKPHGRKSKPVTLAVPPPVETAPPPAVVEKPAETPEVEAKPPPPHGDQLIDP